MKTNSGLIKYCIAQLGKPYWFGTFGQTANEVLYNAKKKQYPNQYKASDFRSQFGQRVHDCSGLIKGYLWSDDENSVPQYNSGQDTNASGFFMSSNPKGDISTFDRVPGRLLFRGKGQNMTHVGVYIGDGYVIEAKGHSYGVVKTRLESSKWTHWGQCKFIEGNSIVKPQEGQTGANASEISHSGTQQVSSPAKECQVIAKSGLNVRVGPGLDFKVTRALNYGAGVRVLEQSAGWGRIGERQWVCMKWLA